jgi:hypothetical protein
MFAHSCQPFAGSGKCSDLAEAFDLLAHPTRFERVTFAFGAI